MFYKNLREAKNIYYNTIFSDNNKKSNALTEGETNLYQSNKMWANLKENVKVKSSGTPQNILIKGSLENSPAKIANFTNEFFIKKIRKIRRKFPSNCYDPLLILNKLIGRNRDTFNLPLLTIQDTKKLIKKAKNSWTICDGDISMNCLKKLNNEIAPHLTHLFNSIIRSGIYPDVLRISKIIPLLKSGKPSHIIDGYRPVNILGPIDKLFQEHLKNNLEGF